MQKFKKELIGGIFLNYLESMLFYMFAPGSSISVEYRQVVT